MHKIHGKLIRFNDIVGLPSQFEGVAGTSQGKLSTRKIYRGCE